MGERDVTAAQSAKIGNLGFAFILLVVAGHVGWVADGLFGQVAIAVVVRSFARVSVPFYFLVSGFFLAAHWHETGWWSRAIRKRVWSLFVPYVLWLTIFAAGTLVLTGQWVAGLGGYGFNPCRMPMLGALWYVRCLMVFVVVSPLLKRLVECWGVGWIVALYLANIALSVLTGCGILDYESGLGGLLGYGVSIEGLVYFSLGLYLQDHRISPRSSRGPILALLFGCGLVATRVILECSCVPFYIHPSVLMTPFLLLGLWHFTPSTPWPRGLTSCTFPIYLMHGLVLSWLWQCGIPRDSVWQWVVFVLGVVVPIVLCHALRRWWPVAAKTLFGGR